jgi:hypothetical protein
MKNLRRDLKVLRGLELMAGPLPTTQFQDQLAMLLLSHMRLVELLLGGSDLVTDSVPIASQPTVDSRLASVSDPSPHERAVKSSRSKLPQSTAPCLHESKHSRVSCQQASTHA